MHFKIYEDVDNYNGFKFVLFNIIISQEDYLYCAQDIFKNLNNVDDNYELLESHENTQEFIIKWKENPLPSGGGMNFHYENTT